MNLSYVSLRCTSAAGADPDSKIGEDHDPETHLIPLVLDVVRGKRDKLKIFGDPPVLIGNSDKIRKNLGWNPKYYRLDAIIETA